MAPALVRCAVAWLSLSFPSAATGSEEEAVTLAALAADAQCGSLTGSEAEHCALNAMQLRGLKTQQELAEGESCESSGCGVFDSSRGCQCNDKCKEHGNCCDDYSSHCEEQSCAKSGCGGKFIEGHSCQCNDQCQEHGNCCHDYVAVCKKGEGDTCAALGCGDFVEGRSCQCNDKCKEHGNCCSDYEASCEKGGGPSCANYGCVGFIAGHGCQCNPKCLKYGNCCEDYKARCPGRAAAPAKGNSTDGSMTMPPGVNLGGWLVLEDWMFSGTKGRHVMTTGTVGQGNCLPPMLPASSETWASEGILTKKLQDAKGSESAIDVISAHRKAYIGDEDLAQIASLGVKEVRVPLPWTTFADALVPLDKVYALGAKIVPDPYYHKEASFVTVDRAWLATLLKKGASLGLKFFLDMHNMPGGSSDATYNGVWPLPPKFWTGSSRIGDKPVPLTDVGMWITKAFVKWVENLGPAEKSAVAGLTLLNEPGHMSYLNKVKGKPFVEDEKQVMHWVEKSSDVFRQSSLPASGMKLHVSIIESAFQYFWDTAPVWWKKAFSAKERNSWAVFDIHFYDAWTPKCSGRIAKGGGYTCDQPLENIRSLIDACHDDYMSLFAKNVDGLKACTEFSVATFEDPVLACNGDALLKMYLSEQVKVFKRFEIESFFWTWRMPHGKNFQKAWSLKHLAGLETATVGC